MTDLTSNDEVAFEAWWDRVNRESFRVAYGLDEPYRDGWGAGHKGYARMGWMAHAASPAETGGESDPPTDGQLLDVLEEAFSNQENGYVEQNVGLRKALATLCVRFNRNADTWRAKKRVADTCPHCGQEPCGCDDPRSFV